MALLAGWLAGWLSAFVQCYLRGVNYRIIKPSVPLMLGWADTRIEVYRAMS
jgi:hypothetical protein